MHRREISYGALFILLSLLFPACSSDRGDPGGTETHYNRSLALIEMGRNGEALREVEAARAIEPGRYDFLKTDWELRFKRDEGAAEELKGLQEENPEDADYPRILSVLLTDPADRLQAGRRAVSLLPNEPGVHQELADIFAAIGLPDSADFHYARSVELDPSNASARLARAALNQETGEVGEAKATYWSVVKEGEGGDGYDTAVRRLFFLEWEQGDRARAIDLARSAGDRVEDPWLLNDIAWTLADAGKEIPLAKEMVRRGIEQMTAEHLVREYPEIDRVWAEKTAERYRGYFFDTLGYVYHQAGEMEQAVTAYEEAVDQIPYVDPDLMVELASAYAEGGRLDDAIESLLRVLSVSENDGALSRLESFYIERNGDTLGLRGLISRRRRDASEPAVDFEMTSLAGEKTSLSDYTGEVVLLNFWFPT